MFGESRSRRLWLRFSSPAAEGLSLGNAPYLAAGYALPSQGANRDRLLWAWLRCWSVVGRLLLPPHCSPEDVGMRVLPGEKRWLSFFRGESLRKAIF